LGFEHRLADDGGRFDVRGFNDDITDAIDPIPLFDDRGVLVSASGNIPSARRYGVEAKASVRLGPIGLPDAQVSLRGLRQWSRIEDPFTGLPRRLGDDRSYAYDVGFRHDLTAWRMSYGFNYRDGGRATINSDLLVTEYYTIEPLLDAFVERGLSRNLTVRLELQNLTHSPERRWRTLYAVNAIDGAVRRVDFFEERRDIRGALKVRGRF
jgi:outer membrane receptor for ferrienterochelin and colicins